MTTNNEKQNENQVENNQATTDTNTTAQQNNQSSSIVDDVKAFANKMFHHEDKVIRYASYGVCGLVGLIIFCGFIALKLNSPRGKRIADRFDKITSDISSMNKSNSSSSKSDKNKLSVKQLEQIADTMKKQMIGKKIHPDLTVKDIRLGEGISYVMEYTVSGETLEKVKTVDRAEYEESAQKEACKIMRKNPQSKMLMRKIDHVIYEYKGADDVIYGTVKVSADICKI